MVVSHRYRYFYSVIPKSASATVRMSLREFTDVGYPVTRGRQHVPLRQLPSAARQRYLEGAYFRFTFVRNPYDRLYSGYVQDRLAATQSERWRAAKAEIFERIGDDFNRYLLEHVRFANVAEDWDWICFCPMHEFAYLDGRLVLDFVGRAESVADGLKTLSDRLGIAIEKAPDQNVNVSPTEHLKYLDRYRPETIELVNEMYALDFERFGYQRLDPASPRVR